MDIKTTELVPVYKEIMGDLNTPVSALLKLDQPNCFLLESVTGGENVARYSFLGFDPFCTFISRNGVSEYIIGDQVVKSEENPIDILEQLTQSYDVEENEELPPFIGGAVGYFSWEIYEYIENVRFKEKNGTPFPLAHFMFPRCMMIFDHAMRKIILVVLSEKDKVQDAYEQIDDIKSMLMKPYPYPIFDLYKNSADDIFSAVKSNSEKSQYMSDVERVKKHIYEGDVFQLVLSQKFSIEAQKKPFDVYRSLRGLNPSPYMFYFNFDEYHIVGSSPEILTRLEGRKATVRPIAGTRPRIRGVEQELVRDLMSDAKECAEHIMLVDLWRNDLGRVCQYDSVFTTDLMDVEYYSHVLHMVSNVEGELLPDKTAFDLFKATFPAGTLSGAPKVKAVKIIEELEVDKRGPYGGALGYFDFRGNMDLCIVIRTILCDGDQFYIQAGAGIVADSDPEKEYLECRNKAKGMLEACYKRKMQYAVDD